MRISIADREDFRSSESRLKVGRWAGLIAGGVAGSGVGFEVVHGANIVVDLGFSLTGGSGNPARDLVDLDGDESGDLSVVLGTASVADAAGHDGIVNIFGLGGAAVALSSGGYPTAFQASQMIGASLMFGTEIKTLAWSSGGQMGGVGNWLGGADAYLGVRFDLGGILHYGWIHAVWDAAAEVMTLGQFGYDDGGAAVVVPSWDELPQEFSISYGAATDVDAGVAELLWPVLAGRTYLLQRSLDLINWEQIHEVTAGSDGTEDFLDDDYLGDLQEQVFYRVEQKSGMPLMLLAMGRRRRSSWSQPARHGRNQNARSC